jgi:dihydrofolate reductase
MRKLKLQMQTSVDGFVSTGPNDEQKWVTWALDDIFPNVMELLDSIDTIIIGRKLAVDYIPYWQGVVTKPDDPMYRFAQRIVAAKKIVFTRTLAKSDPVTIGWGNTELAKKGDFVDEIKKLKEQTAKDIIVYGGCSFVSALVKEGLIDEFHLFVNPVALGNGVPIFNELKKIQNLKLKKSIVYNSGIVMLNYEPHDK